MSRKSITHVAAVGTANLLYGIFQWAMLIGVAHATGTGETGAVSLALSLVTPWFLLSNLGLRPLLISEKSFNPALMLDYLLARMGTTLVALVLLVVCLPLLAHDGFNPLYVLFLGLMRAAESFQDITTGALQKQRHFVRSAAYMGGRAVASTVTFFVTLKLFGVMPALATLAAVALLFFALVDLPGTLATAKLPLHHALAHLTATARKRQGQLLWVSGPLGITAALVSLLQLVPRYALAHTSGTDAVGQFAAIHQIIQVGTVLSLSIGQTIAPTLNSAYHEGDWRTFGRITGTALAVLAVPTALGVVVASLFAAPLLTLIYGPAFAPAAPAVWVLGIGGLFSYLSNIFGYGMTAACLRLRQMLVVGGTLTVGIVLCLTVLPRMPGVVGAAWVYAGMSATVCVFAALGILHEYSRRAR